jgi:hypothetical protein
MGIFEGKLSQKGLGPIMSDGRPQQSSTSHRCEANPEIAQFKGGDGVSAITAICATLEHRGDRRFQFIVLILSRIHTPPPPPVNTAAQIAQNAEIPSRCET